jgi:hypothetical protein
VRSLWKARASAWLGGRGSQALLEEPEAAAVEGAASEERRDAAAPMRAPAGAEPEFEDESA